MKRYIAPDNSKQILVVRIKCEKCYQKKQETGRKIQYTITVLPGFLIPHSRVPVPDLWCAVNGYLSENKTQQQAALLMNCNSRHSFNLYYKRLCMQLNLWIVTIASILNTVLLQEQKQCSDVRIKWKQFKNFIKRLGGGQKESAFSDNIISRFQFVHAIMCCCKMGLGP